MSGSQTRSELQKLRRKLKKAGLLADMACVSRAAISRILSGKSRPSGRTVRNLAASLDKRAGAMLLAAFLTDEIPDDLRRYLRVEVRDGGTWNHADRFYQQFELLRPEQRQLVASLVQQLLHPHDPNSPLIYMERKK